MLVRRATFAMGTCFESVLAGADGAMLEALSEAVSTEVEEWDARLSLFRRDSLVSHINRTAAERPVRLDRDTFDLLRACAGVHGASDGAFDVTVAPAMRAFGFHESDLPVVPQAELTARVGAAGLVLDEPAQTIRFARPGMALDLGAVGKGHALDIAAEILREHGGAVSAALLHGGTSTVTALSCPPGSDGFEIAVRCPHRDPAERRANDNIARVRLRDQSLSVSTRYGRTAGPGRRLRSHVIDPRTARPVEGGPDLVAVVGPSARLCDAWSTAILALGRRPQELSSDYATLIVRTDDRGTFQCDLAGARSSAFTRPLPARTNLEELPVK